jgi:glycosyltransferase involved in cell wall biosynthesis
MGFERMRKLRIGYWPLSESLLAAGDRRRLVFWANSRGHELVRDLTRNVDVIVASENSDFNSVLFRQKSTPVVFDLVDAYLSPLNLYDDLARGLAKHLSGQISGAVKPFSRHVRDFCKISDAVICSSPEQRELILRHNANTHTILDSHDEIAFIVPPQYKDMSRTKQKILWEGQPATIGGVKGISSVLASLALSRNLHLNFVTDESYFQLLNRYLKRSTSERLNRDLSLIAERVKVIPWTPANLVEAAQSSTVAMIPIDISIPMQRLKPENRLLIMWRLGLPCLTSPSPAYLRVANQAGVNAICNTLNDWAESFDRILSDPGFARSEILAGQSYLRENHNREKLLDKWDSVFESVMS